MSQENVVKVGRLFELFNRREMDAWVEMLATDVEWHVDPQDPDTTVHRGREAVGRYGQDWVETMDALVEVRQVFEAGDQVVAWTRVNSRGGASGVPVGLDLAFIFTLRHGLATRIEETQDMAEALDTTCLSE
jgi:ketosteroid isomerase-like protein